MLRLSQPIAKGVRSRSYFTFLVVSLIVLLEFTRDETLDIDTGSLLDVVLKLDMVDPSAIGNLKFKVERPEGEPVIITPYFDDGDVSQTRATPEIAGRAK